ncbi:hypothetical protein WR25_11863 [Diploscapter pachys]|uniref:Uncharacterized protein n=1 Tax=Diploscapter pachys TaxID=2018661 RepID=A0A2A2LIA5_9BILA|nr:hypothetical protein WR25_11863 [Diploscapter pachys]
MRKALEKHMKVAGEPAGFLLAMFLWVRHLPYFSSKYAAIKSNVDMMFKLFDEQIRVHQKNIDYDSEDSTDIVEAYLKEMKKREHEPDFGGFE